MAKTKALTRKSLDSSSAKSAKKAAKRAAKQVAHKSSAKGIKKARKSDGDGRGGDKKTRKEKKAHKWRPGTKALMEIKRLTGGKGALTPCTQRAPVERLFRELVADECDGGKRMQAKAVDALREAMEMGAVRVFERCREINGVAKRVTIDEACLKVAAKAVFGEHFFGDENPKERTPALSTVARSAAASPKKKAVKKPSVKKAASSSSESTSDSSSDEQTEERMVVDDALGGVPLPPLMDVEDGAR